MHSTLVIKNHRAHYDYFVEKKIEAGISLQGWEVQSIRAGKVSIIGGYASLRDSEAYLSSIIIYPLSTASSHVYPNFTRNRKLLLNKREIDSLSSYVNRRGYSAIALSLYWKNKWIKVEVGIAKGKKNHDKRVSTKNREWQIDKARIVKYLLK